MHEVRPSILRRARMAASRTRHARPARLVAGALAVAAGLAAAAATASIPAGSGTQRVFDVHVGGIRAGELILSGERNGAAYVAGSTIRATGIAGALTRYRYEGTSTGRLGGDGAIVPQRHVASSSTARSGRTTDMVFENGNPARVSTDPPRRRQANPARHAGTIDPVSAAFAILINPSAERLCNRRIELFDGHRRSQLLVGQAEPDGNGRVSCNGSYARLSGASLAVNADDEWGFRLVYRVRNSGAVEVERIEAPTSYGLAVVTPR
jgi:hypothetical protein